MGRPKALLLFGGRTFLENILDNISAASVEYTVVVLGHHRDEIVAAVQVENPVFNPDYELGMTTSMKAGIRALPGQAKGAFVFLVDHPLTRTTTIEALARHFRPGHIVLPTFDGRRGHPVLFSREVLEEILSLPASLGANTIVWKDPSRIIEVPVEDAGIRIDIDTPEQFKQLRRKE